MVKVIGYNRERPRFKSWLKYSSLFCDGSSCRPFKDDDSTIQRHYTSGRSSLREDQSDDNKMLGKLAEPQFNNTK